MTQIPDEIVRTIDLNVAQTKVWQAISNAQSFGEWFRCTTDGPFERGRILNCRSTYGAEGGASASNQEEFVWQKRIVAIEPEAYFAFEWTPGDTGADVFSPELGSTLVEFKLAPIDTGTRLTICESGFASLPAALRSRSFRINSGGWDAQVQNITQYFNE